MAKNEFTQRFLWICVRLCEINHETARLNAYDERLHLKGRLKTLEAEEGLLYKELEEIWHRVDLPRLKTSLETER